MRRSGNAEQKDVAETQSGKTQQKLRAETRAAICKRKMWGGIAERKKKVGKMVFGRRKKGLKAE